MLAVVVIVLLFWTLWFAGPYIRRWLARRSMNYVQDRMFRSMGIDPEEVRRARKEQPRKQSGADTDYRRRKNKSRPYGKIIPEDYGEAVMFEVLTVTGQEQWLRDTDKSPVFTEYRKETQITDVKYVLVE